MHKVKDISLSARVDDAEASWWRILMPVSTHLGEQLSGIDLSGLTAA